VEYQIRRFPDKPMGDHGLRDGGTAASRGPGRHARNCNSGQRMHETRHTAGQRVLDVTGNLKATQKLLGHASIETTGDVYADWDIDQLADDESRSGVRK
jgi:integrase